MFTLTRSGGCLIRAGLAQAVAGNHEVNLLRRERKHGSHWFY